MGGVRRFWTAYSRALDERPLRTKAATALFIFTAADTLRQQIESHHHSKYFVWDVQRTMRLSVFYAVVHAPWVHHWYTLLDRVLGKTIAFRIIAAKVAADQLISMPAFMTVLLSSQALLAGHDLAYCQAKLRRDLFPTIQ